MDVIRLKHWAQCYKTFFVTYELGKEARVFVPGRPF
jgi:hypothetical protein